MLNSGGVEKIYSSVSSKGSSVSRYGGDGHW